MALIKCPECGQMISDRAVSCIKCGYPIKELGGSDESKNSENTAPSSKEKTMDAIKQNDHETKSTETNSIPRGKLIEYLKHGIAICSELYGFERIMTDYTAACENNKPVLVEKPMPIRPMEQSTEEKGYGVVLLVIGIFALVMGIVLASLRIDGVVGFFPLPIVIISFVLIIVGCVNLSRAKEINNSNCNELADYERKKQWTQEENEAIRENYRQNLENWANSKTKGLKFLEKKLGEIEKAANDYFSVDIVYPKYINLVALSSFYEYLSSGRCKELAGPNGCYNLFESEIRQNIIITQLETIITNLEQIRQNQYTLYEELKKTTSALNQISSDLRIVRDLTFDLTELASINAYYNGVTAANTAALTFLETVR